MYYMIEFTFYSIYFFMKLYSLVDHLCILTTHGEKLDRYIKDKLPNIAYNFEEHNIKNLVYLIFSNIIYSRNLLYSLLSPKKIYITSVIYINIIMIKFAFTYSFIKSNFLYIHFFSKNIDIASKLGRYFIIFKVLYYVFFSIFIISIIYQFVSYYIEKTSYKTKVREKKEGFDIILGKDEKDKDVMIHQNGLFQNILITGSIGSGKTSSAITNIVAQLISKRITGLIIDIKGNYVETVEKILKKQHSNLKLIKISLENDFCYNPLDNNEIETVELANRIRHILTLLSVENNSDPYWLDKVESFLRDFIILIRADKKIVSFYEIHLLVNDKFHLQSTMESVKKRILKNQYNDQELFSIQSAICNIKNEFFKLDERTIGIIKSEITRITGIFVSDYQLYQKFCMKSEKLDFSKYIYVLSIPVGKNRNLAKIIATYLKLDFQKQILSNIYFQKPIFFVCDEYSEIANDDDAHFFSLSREYQCINIISIQSYTSLINAFNREYPAKVIIQNLVNKIWFRNDDTYTIGETIKLIGKESKKYQTMNLGENAKGTYYNPLSRKFKNYASTISKSYSFQEKKEYKFDEDYFTVELKTFETICLISDGMKMNLIKKCKFKRWE